MLEKANELGLGQGESDDNKMSIYYAKRMVEMFDIWHNIFSDDTDRIIRVLGGFIAHASKSDMMLNYENTASKVDVLAFAIYFGGYLGYPEVESTVQDWNLDQLFNELNNGGLTNDEAQNGAMPEIFAYIDNHVTVANNFDLDLITYEGGQHLCPIGTVEGNTNSSGGREGIEVAQKKRKINFEPKERGLVMLGFIHPIS